MVNFENQNNQVMKSNQFLTFKLGNDIYAIDVAKVREVLDFPNITKVPKMPEYMCGVINLRGNVVPVVDLRLKFGMPKTERTINTCIIVVEAIIENENSIIGAVADSVQEVIELESKLIEPPPKIGSKLKAEFIKGVGKLNDQFIMILDIDKVFSNDDVSFSEKTT